MKHSLIGLLALLFVMACTPTVPSQFIQPDEMEDLLYDYHVAQAMARLDHPGESGEVEKNRNFLAVLNKYGVTQAKFDSSLVYYYSHLDKLKKIYIEVNERLSDNAKSLGADVGTMGHFSQYTANGDTANIWTGTTDLLLMPRPTMNRFDFHGQGGYGISQRRLILVPVYDRVHMAERYERRCGVLCEQI